MKGSIVFLPVFAVIVLYGVVKSLSFGIEATTLAFAAGHCIPYYLMAYFCGSLIYITFIPPK